MAKAKKKPAKLVDEPMPELENLIHEIPRMSRLRKGRLRERLQNRIVNHAVRLGLSKEEAQRRIGDGTILQWFIDHGPQIVAVIKVLLSILAML